MTNTLDKKSLFTQLKSLHKNTVFFGPQGFNLATTDSKLNKAQQGFSTYPNGNYLPSEQAGLWQKNWLVIATDTELGDPYFIDTSNKNSAVYTAMLNEDNIWQQQQVAHSLASFIDCLKLLNNHAQQSEAQFIVEKKTITDNEQLNSIKNVLIEISASKNFWTLFFECYQDWLTDIDEIDD